MALNPDLAVAPSEFSMTDVNGDFKVSETSSWGDNIWHFEATTAGAYDVAIRWNFKVGQNSHFTDALYAGLLEQSRRFFWSLITNNQRGRNPKVASYPNYYIALKSLIRWMIVNNLDTFSQLNPNCCVSYIEESFEKIDNKSIKTYKNISLYADMVCRIYEQSVVLRNFKDNIIIDHPFGGKSANEISLEISGRKSNGFIPPVPDRIYIASIVEALEWMDVRSIDILNLQHIHLSETKDVSVSMSHSYSWRLNNILSMYQFDAGRTLEQPWRMKLSPNNAISELRLLFGKLRDAAIVAIQGMLGLRISEICGISAGHMAADKPWPTCISTSPSISGYEELFHLHGRVFKQRDQYDEVTWLAGSRPMGSDYIPPVVRAITVLWKLFRPWRELGKREELIVALKPRRGFPRHKDSIGKVHSRQLSQAQCNWIKQNVDIPSDLVHWRVTTHQWRKSFAMYMIRSDARLLPAVRDHFKHISVAMTERGYLGRDPEMLGLLDHEATYAAAQFLFGALNGQPAAGKMMDTINQNLHTIQELVGGDGTDEEKIRQLAAILKNDDVRVWDSPWGGCLFRSERARCHFLACGSFDLSARRPHFALRQAAVCCDCSNLLVFTDNIDFWNARFKSNLAVFEANMLAGEHNAAAVSAVRVRSSAAILRRLGVLVTWNDEMLEGDVNGEAAGKSE